MSTATQLFNGSDGGAVGTLTGYSSWTWGNDAAGSALLRTADSLEGASALRVDPTCKQATYGCAPAAGTHYASIYVKLPAAPSAALDLCNLYASGYYLSQHIGITADRRLFVITAAYDYNTASDPSLTNGTVQQSSANVVPIGAWFRVDIYVSATSAGISLFVGSNLHGSSPDYGAYGTSSSIGAYDLLQVGPMSANASATRTFVSSGQTLWIDRLVVSDSAMPSPYSATTHSGAAALSATSTLTAAATPVRLAAAALTTAATLVAAAGVGIPATAPLTSTSTLTAAGTLSGNSTSASLTATSTLTSGAVVARPAAAALAASSTLVAGATIPTYYPGVTRTHARPTIYDSPHDSTKGGPQVLGTIATETEAISDDLNAAMLEGSGPFANMRAVVAALWSAISGKANTGHTHAASDLASGTIAAARLPDAASGTKGAVTPPGGTSTFYRADGTWATPAGGSSTGRQTAAQRTVFVGDSTLRFPGDQGSTLNDGRTITNCWPTFTSMGTGQRAWHIRNAAIGGDWSDNLVARFSADVLTHDPGTVVIGIGTNDLINVVLGTSGFSYAEWQANIATLVADTRTAGAVPVLCTMPPINASVGAGYKAAVPKWNAWLKRYAATEGIAVIDVYAAVVDATTGDWGYGLDGGDGVHPSEYGCTFIAAAANAVLNEILPPWTPVLTTDNTDAANLLTNGCMVTDTGADGTPDGWTNTGTLNLGTDTTFCVGKYVRLGSGEACSQSETVGGGSPTVSVGDLVAISGRIRTTGASPWAQEFKVTVTFNGSTGPVVLEPIADIYGDLTGTFYLEYVVPAGTTSITVALSAGSGSGTADFGQVGLFNLTALAA